MNRKQNWINFVEINPFYKLTNRLFLSQTEKTFIFLHFGNFFAYLSTNLQVMKFPYTIRSSQYLSSKQQMIITTIHHGSLIYLQTSTSQYLMMKTQIDHQEVANYAKRLASMLCNQFYRQHSAITGKQVVEFTQNKQVNFFAVKAIFMKWQDEMTNLRSPYFDYTNPEVAKNLTTLMNLLSQNILIARPAFEPVVEVALADTLLLHLSPKSFFEKMLTEIGENIHVANQVKPMAKYIKANKNFFDRLLAYLEREANPTISQSRAVSLVQTVAQENLPADDSQDLFNFLSQYIPVSAQNFVAKNEDHDQDPLAFDISTILPTQQPVYQQVVQSPIEKQIEKPVEKVVETIKTNSTIYAPVIQQNHYQEPVKVVAETPVEANKVAETIETTSVNQQFNTSQETSTTVHQHLALDQDTNNHTSLHDTTDTFKGLPLGSLIPLNKRFSYVNGLFGGSSEEFEQAIAMIDQCSDYHKAIMLIKDKYFRRFAWDLEKDEVKEFYEMVSKKF